MTGSERPHNLIRKEKEALPPEKDKLEKFQALGVHAYSIEETDKLRERLESGEKLIEDNIEGLLRSRRMGLLQEFSDLDAVKKVFNERIKGVGSPEAVKRIEKEIEDTLFIKRTTIGGVNKLKRLLEGAIDKEFEKGIIEEKVLIYFDETKTTLVSVKDLMPIRRTPDWNHSTIVKLRGHRLEREGKNIDPIVVFKHWSGRSPLVDGHHRAVAAKIGGVKELPAYILKFSNKFFEPRIVKEDCYKDKERKIPKTVEDIKIMLDEEKRIISFNEFKKLVEEGKFQL